MTLPRRSGLYDPKHEHDACGIGFVANIDGKASHRIVQQGLQILLNLVHRGASGCDPLTGDGAGLLLQMPHEFFKKECQAIGIDLPNIGEYGIGCVFLPQDPNDREKCERILEDKVLGTGQKLLGWRDVPVRSETPGPVARRTVPYIRQIVIGSSCASPKEFERKLYVIRKWAERTVVESDITSKTTFYLPSLSSKTICYKGLLLADQLAEFYLDLKDDTMVSALAMVHQRFSTNTFPTWELAQPFRMLCHNGEINTVRGNKAWMRAREQVFDGKFFGEDVHHILPIIDEEGSDSACLDNAAEMLIHAGRGVDHVMMMMVPEAWQNDELMAQQKRDFYAYHSCLMEPWDGPAALAFTDGDAIGAILDRNGLRPARWIITKDNDIVMGSETGVLEFPPEDIRRKGRLEPGRMLLVDLKNGKLVEDDDIKRRLSSAKPYGKWLKENMVRLEDLDDVDVPVPDSYVTSLVQRQKMFGYSLEDLRILLGPMAQSGAEPTGSMGTDTPLAVLSDQPQVLYNYFKQHFAQVTNPAIDPIREELVMSLKTYVGPEGNLLEELPDQAQMLELDQPILTNRDLAKVRHSHIKHHRQPPSLPMLYKLDDGGAGLKAALDELCRLASVAVTDEHSFIILSDRNANEKMAPVPALLATAAVHHHLVRNGTRTKLGIIVETGEAREVHHFCLLTGYGAAAVNPYVAMESIADMVGDGTLPGVTNPDEAVDKYIKAIKKGMLKVMSKMGISTLQSYRGAQIFECIGLEPNLVERYFTGTDSRISGIGIDVLATECEMRFRKAFPINTPKLRLDVGGNYHFRVQGERHLWNPRTVGALQRAVRLKDKKSFSEYSSIINNQTKGLITLRGMWEFTDEGTSVPLDEVEPATEIVKRFATGAMSYGSISAEAHENLAMAMNAIGGKSNTGEGGEKDERFTDNRRSAIKQVASGRFGVTTHYMVNADELQIKVAQGAKPGEGGQLPGHKVDYIIAKTRHSTPGVTLISPPPHHDIYSIEDLAQLIFDLKMANPRARISVKLVSEAGVGTVAAGVAKAHADLILISGYDGGTGASPQTSIKHAGVPWELGLAETHQVLVKNDLRSRVVVQTDGQMRTGKDVVMATMLGAEEYGFATAPLIASGCVMMRKCHLNTCPVGIATQDPELRKKFEGKPEHVINFMFYVAEEVREIMGKLGFRTISEMVGRVDRLTARKDLDHWKARHLDFSDVLHPADRAEGVGVFKSQAQDHGVDRSLDVKLIAKCSEALDSKKPVSFTMPIRNVDRTVGTQLAGELTRRYGAEGLPEDTIKIRFEGTAGQSFGAFVVNGMSIELSGDANDYVGKGMSGGVTAIFPPAVSSFSAEENVIVGNVALYGATGGRCFFNGMGGERFCVRNSGATAVVEGIGDHGCEYMTGGRAIIIGRTGRNFGAGMSGGIAFVLDAEGDFKQRCNMEMVTLERLDSDDEVFLKNLLQEHVDRTTSPKAKALLDDWSTTSNQFVKVFPSEYRRVLNEANQAKKATTPSTSASAPALGR
ncbi:MAG: glutamate synthase large subunit [Polyangiaceae bacterium]|nr:glutamate synthase large subunit [Polyangiaceae bacterium]